MANSLLKLIQENGDLRAVDRNQISYPEIGARELSQLERDHFWFVTRREVVLKLLTRYLGKKETPPKGLDVGCGTGYTAEWLSRRDLCTFGIDAHPNFQIEPSSRTGKLISGDIFSLDPVAEFDFLLLLDVVEHIKDDAGFIDQCARFLKPGGVLILTVPAFERLWTERDERAGHFRRYTKAEIAKRLGRIRTKGEIELQSYFYAATLPLYLFWILKEKLVKDRRTSAFQVQRPPGFANEILKQLLRLEMVFLPFGGLPAGSSLVSVFRKS